MFIYNLVSPWLDLAEGGERVQRAERATTKRENHRFSLVERFGDSTKAKPSMNEATIDLAIGVRSETGEVVGFTTQKVRAML